MQNATDVSDKSAGVVALSLFDMRRRGKVDRLLMAGTNGTKFPHVRRHIEKSIAAVYGDMNVAFDSYPDDSTRDDPNAFLGQWTVWRRVTWSRCSRPTTRIFASPWRRVERGLHVLVAKPIVKTLEEHRALAEAARRNGVLVAMEVHKRWDPIYADARDRIRQLGEFSFFQSFMSQPKYQLETFRPGPANRATSVTISTRTTSTSTVWSVGTCRPADCQSRALASTGVAKKAGIDAEDTITLGVQWENLQSGSLASAFYTASWIAPKSDVHSQQRFYYLGAKGRSANRPGSSRLFAGHRRGRLLLRPIRCS